MAGALGGVANDAHAATLRLDNGDVYDGPLRHGELHGPGGTYVWSDGARYQGAFWHNLRHGKVRRSRSPFHRTPRYPVARRLPSPQKAAFNGDGDWL